MRFVTWIYAVICYLILLVLIDQIPIPSISHMATSQPSSSSGSLAAAAGTNHEYPHWVLLDTGDHHWELQANACQISTDAKTAAHARTSTGDRVRASFLLAAPPAMSYLNLNFDGGLSADRVAIYYNIIAAHGDLVLVCVSTYGDDTLDYLVYRAGDGTDQLPSLSLLPPRYIDEKSAGLWRMRDGTGILRHGDGEFVVATNLEMKNVRCDQDGGGVKVKRAEAEFHQLRSSKLQWEIQRIPVQGKVSFDWWVTDKVIPVAGRFFYWVDLHKGIVFSDVREQSPELRFVPLPADPLGRERTDTFTPHPSRNVCATDGGATVKFVLVSPRCCCGCPAVTTCALSRHEFSVTTWTLRSTQAAGGMVWEKDGMVDSGELWARGTYRRLPRLPVASIDDPDIVCFLASKRIRHSGENTTVAWIVMIDMKTKSLVGTAPILSTERDYDMGAILSSQVSRYFNTSPGSRRPTRRDSAVPRASTGGIQVSLQPATDDSVASPDEEISAALQKIPGLTADEMIRAYRALACNDRRRYRSLVALPMDMRKDYCGMLVDMEANKQTEA